VPSKLEKRTNRLQNLQVAMDEVHDNAMASEPKAPQAPYFQDFDPANAADGILFVSTEQPPPFPGLLTDQSSVYGLAVSVDQTSTCSQGRAS